MDIRQIELFIAAAEEQHFTRAAKRANIVQSGLSVAIRGLEEELGTLLFVRNTRHVELSEAGRIFLPEARRILLATKAARGCPALRICHRPSVFLGNGDRGFARTSCRATERGQTSRTDRRCLCRFL